MALLAAVMIATADVSHAQSCAVWTNASDGSDQNSGTQFQPLQSFEAGVAALADGQTLCVSAGEYFQAADSDGIQVALGSRNVTILLQAFGGDSEVRFTEKEWRIESDGGTLTFERAGAETLAFGPGVVNTEILAPASLNFLHSFLVLAGTVDFGSIPTEFGPSVGNASFVNPGNPDDRSPAEARIEWGGIVAGSNLIYGQAPRNWLISGNPGGMSRAISLPAMDAGSRLSLAATGPLTLLSELVLEDGASLVIPNTASGTIDLSAGIRLGNGSSIEQSGAGEAILDVTVPTGANAGIILDGALPTILRAITTAEGGSANLAVGAQGVRILESSTIRGSAVINGPSVVAGDLSIATSSSGNASLTINAPVTLENGASLRLSNAFPAPSPVFLATSAAIAGGLLTMEGAFSLDGGGSTRLDLLGTASVDIVLASILGDLGLETGQSASFSAPGSRIDGLLDIQGGALSISTDTLSAGSLRMSAGTITANDNVLALQGDLSIASGEVSGLQVQIKEASSSIVNTVAPLSALRASDTSVSIQGPVSVAGPCVTENSDLTLNEASHLSCDAIQTVNGSLTMERDARMDASDQTIMTGTTWSADAGTVTGFRSLTFNGNEAPTVTGMTLQPVGASSSLQLGAPIAVSSLTLPGNQHSMTLAGTLDIQAPLATEHNVITLESDAVLRVDGNLTCDAGSIIARDRSEMVLRGTGSVRCIDDSPFAVHSVSASGTRSFLSNMTLGGDLALSTEQASFAEGSVISVAGSWSMTQGSITVGDGSTVSVSGALTGLDSTIDFGIGTDISVDQDVSFRRSEVTLGTSVLRLSSRGVAEFDRPVQLRSLMVRGEGSARALRIPNSLNLSESLNVEAQSTLVLSDGPVIISSPDGTGRSQIDGTVTGDTASEVRFNGAGGILSGSGTIRRLSLSLAESQSRLVIEGGPMVVSDQLTLVRGLLDLTGSNLQISPDATAPFILSVAVLGDRFAGGVASWPQMPENSTNRPVSLNMTGQATAFLPFDGLATLGPIADLVIEVEDAFNAPPVFGLTTSVPLSITGGLSLAAGNRFISPGLTLQEAAQHMVHGSTTRLTLSAGGTIEGGSTGAIESLQILSGNAVMRDLASVDSLNVSGAELTVGASSPTQITRLATLDQSSLRIESRMDWGREGQLLAFQATGTAITFADQGSITLKGEGFFDADGQSSVRIENADSEAGFVDLQGTFRITVPAGLPRVSLSTASATLNMGGDLLISERLDALQGSIDLASHTLTGDGALFRLDGVDLIGPPSGSNATLSLTGTSTLSMDRSHILDRTDLYVAPGGGTLDFASSSSSQPVTLTLNGGGLSVAGGMLDLGENDLIIQTSATGRVDLNDAHITGRVRYPVDERISSVLSDQTVFPFSDDQVGELIVLAPGNTNIEVTGSNSISALRVESPSQLVGATGSLAISDRLVFGQAGAQFAFERTPQLIMASGATIIRRGRGVLSRVPTFEGPPVVAYDLDDGSFQGHDRDFAIGTLVTGNEIPSTATPVEHLILLAGKRDGTANQVRLNKSIRVANSMTLWSGGFDPDQYGVDLLDGGVLRFLEVDVAARPSFIRSNAITNSGAMDLRIHSSSLSFVVNNELVPSGATIGHLTLSLSQATPSSFVLTTPVSAANIAISGAQQSVVNLFGSTLSSSESMTIDNATVRSDALASILASGSFHLTPSGSIQDNVRLSTTESATIQGSLQGLSLTFEGDLTLESPWNPETDLIGSGSGGTLTFETSPLVLNRLVLDASGVFDLRGPEQGVVQVDRQLELRSGRLDARLTPLRLGAGSSLLTDLGWIQGTFQRQALQGVSGALSFPVGTADQALPVDLVLDQPLIAASILGVSADAQEPVVKRGLPSAYDTGTFNDTGVFSWRLTSSVNFGSAQAFRVHSEKQGVASEALALLTWPVASTNAEWTGPAQTLQDQLISALRNTGLDPDGTLITPALAERRSEWASVLVAGPSQPTSSASRLVVGHQVLTDIAVDSSPPSIDMAVPSNGLVTMQLVGTSAASTSPDNTSFDALLAAGSTTYVAWTTDDGPLSSAPHPDVNGVAVFNQSTESLSVVEPFPMASVVVDNLGPQAFSTTHFVTDLSSAFRVSTSSGAEAAFKWSPVGTDVLPGMMVVRDDLSATLYLSDGTALSSTVATSTEQLPDSGSFELMSVFPSPSRSFPSLEVMAPGARHVMLEVFDALGRRVWATKLDVSGGAEQHVMRPQNAPELASGLYVARISTQGGSSPAVSSRAFLIAR